MKAKFLGCMLLAASVAVLSLGSTPETEAGLFSRLFGGRAYNGCGGGGGLQSYGGYAYNGCGGGGGLQMMSYSGCGGGGLQSYGMTYNACGPGGGGGGLQFAPAYYQVPAYHAPAYPTQYSPASNCPGGVCPPSMGGGLTYSQPAYYSPSYVVNSRPSLPSGIRLAPGESYVSGSLRTIAPRTTTKAVTRLVDASTQESRPETKATVEKASRGSYDVNAEYRLVQLSQADCGHCVSDEKEFKKLGVEVEVVKLADDPIRAAALLKNATLPFEGFPYYVLLKNGKPYRDYNRSFGTADEVAAFANSFFPKPEKAETQLASTESDRFARLETLMVKMLETQQKTNEALLSVVKVSSNQK